jgi:hypothetical protein
MLALVPGLITDSTLTKSANQVPNVATQVSAAYCAYRSGWLSDLGLFGLCFAVTVFPEGFIAERLYCMGQNKIRDGVQLFLTGRSENVGTIVELGMSLIRSGVRLVRFTPWGFLAVAA